MTLRTYTLFQTMLALVIYFHQHVAGRHVAIACVAVMYGLFFYVLFRTSLFEEARVYE